MPPVIKKKAIPAKKAKQDEDTTVVSGQLQKKVTRQNARQKLQRGVIFIKHLPHGFFEDQLRSYFEQFGTVTRLRLARSKLTGGTKGYAYVEFEYPEVAEVAAETMDNYLMFNKVVKAAYIPPERQFFNFFKTSVRQVKNKAGKLIYVSGKTAAINRHVKKFNDSSVETLQKRAARKQKKIDKLNKKYAHLGIDFNRIVLSATRTVGKAENSDKAGDNEVPKESGKRLNHSAENSSKKLKKGPELEDLLGETLNEDSDDDDWAAKSAEIVEDEEMTNTDEDDGEEEFDEVDEEDDVEEEDDDEEEDDEDDDEENTPPQKKPKKTAKGNPVKAKPAKEDHIDKLTKHKKHVGGIQKANKAKSKKPKIAKAKNSMHAALTKQMAQPLPLIKNKMKPSKKQKK